MKVHILNDLHIEFEDFTPPGTDADVVVLAGDIGVGTGALAWIERCFPTRPVIYVPGNHEFYHHDLNLVGALQRNAPDHVHLLDNTAVEINGVRFLGCTLWTDFLLFGIADQVFSMQHAHSDMADFNLIRYDGKPFTPKDAIRLHEQSRDWLAQMLAQPFDGKTVVVTHHAPSPRSVHPRYAQNLLTPAFASDLEGLMDASRVALWIHGHMHDAFDYRVHGTRIVCNPRGYAPDQLSEGFRADLVVQV
jgi:Icc-related predicted phosphoesterase